jgi:hypothetical protein
MALRLAKLGAFGTRLRRSKGIASRWIPALDDAFELL